MVDSGHKVVDCRPVASPMVVAHKLEVCKWVASHEEIGTLVVVMDTPLDFILKPIGNK